MKSKIYLENIKIYAFHGALPEENVIGTYYILNVKINADILEAVKTDCLDDTINYAEINKIIHDEMMISSKLLEHVAGRIIDKIGKKFPQVISVKLKIAKTNPPMKGEMNGVSIVLKKNFKN